MSLKRFRYLFGFSCLLWLSLVATTVSAAEPVRVVRVIDGDSLVVSVSNVPRECRLIGIDAPEWAQNPWGERARNYLRTLLDRAGSVLSLETDEELIDKHGRLLVYLKNESGDLINLSLVEEGMAVAFNKRPNVRYASQFRSAQTRARSAKKGIWGPDGLKERPGAFRERTRRRSSAATK